MRRHERSDAQWELIADLMLRAGQQGGGCWRDHRQVVNGLMWKLATGAQWRDLPERYGPWQTIDERFSRWRREGVFDRLLDRLRIKLNAEGLIDLDRWCIDSTSIRASRSAAGAGRKGIPRSRSTMPSAFREGHRHQEPPGDRWGWPAARAHAHPRAAARDVRLRANSYLRRRRIRPVVPPRKGGNMGKGFPRLFDPDLYRRRNVIERCIGWLKGCRSIATRHEKLAANFAAMPAPMPPDPQAVRPDLNDGVL